MNVWGCDSSLVLYVSVNLSSKTSWLFLFGHQFFLDTFLPRHVDCFRLHPFSMQCCCSVCWLVCLFVTHQKPNWFWDKISPKEFSYPLQKLTRDAGRLSQKLPHLNFKLVLFGYPCSRFHIWMIDSPSLLFKESLWSSCSWSSFMTGA